jgi:tol-pal system protein YbgF
MIRLPPTRVLALAVLPVLGGCAHAPSEAALGELRTRLVDAQRKEADGRRRIDELENRLFLLTDKLESYKVVTQVSRPPRLPVVTLQPREAAEPRSENEIPAEEVEFVGAARSHDAGRVRPVLRGDGEHDRGDVRAPDPTRRVAHTVGDGGRSRAAAPAGDDSLGVAPVPPIPKGGSSERKAPPLSDLAALERVPVEEAPIAAYRLAYGDLTSGRYEDAEHKLRAFVRRYPKHDYADNAQYWLGESFYARHRYREAAVEFRAAVARYPVGNKAPDAMLKLAYSLLGAGEPGEGRRLLEELPATYPRSEAARLAAQKLAELGGARAAPASTVSSEEPR